MKETFYFSHDYNARSDPKLIKLSMKMGLSGLGIYWCVVEMLYEQGGYISMDDCESIAYELRTECERIADVIRNFDLFKIENGIFYSETIIKRIQKRNEKSIKAKESANARWSKPNKSGDDANALRTECDGNAIKESKGKENKGNIKKKSIKKKAFVPPSLDEVKQYFLDNGYSESAAIRAFNYYSSGEWHDSTGKQVLNWKGKMQTIWFKPENAIEKPKMKW